MRLPLLLALALLPLSPLHAAQDPIVILITIDGCPATIFDDPSAPFSHTRTLAADGARARALIVSNPTTTWTNHTTLVTGDQPARHSVLFNGLLERDPAALVLKAPGARTKTQLVAVPTIYDAAHAAGLPTAAINWPCTREADSLDDNWPDVPDSLRYITPRLRADLETAGILDPGTRNAKTVSGPRRDEIRTAAACYLLLHRPPALLLLHFACTDGLQHEFGPGSPAAYAGFAWADTLVGRVVAAVDAAGLRDRTTFIVASDHGFTAPREMLCPNAILRQAGLIDIDSAGMLTRARAQVKGDGGTGLLYFSQPAPTPAELEKVAALFRGRPEIADIITPDRYPAFGYPDPARNPLMADLVLVARHGYMIGQPAAGDAFVRPRPADANPGSHGSINTDPDMFGLFVASGRGIQKGLTLDRVTNIDIAPTIARLLALPLPDTDGHPLDTLLATP